MTDAAVRELARHAGIAVQWTDYANKRHRVPLDAVRRILAALGLPCGTPHDISHSKHTLAEVTAPPLITASKGRDIDLPVHPKDRSSRIRLITEDGAIKELSARTTRHGLRVPGIEMIGYHTIEIADTSTTIAVAPARCVTIEDIAPGERVAGLAAQTYGLRSPDDFGIGDMAGVVALARAAAGLGVDALAQSPTHALFAADPAHFSPYSPSSRLFYNPLLADAAMLFGKMKVAKARAATGLGMSVRESKPAALIDWTQSSRAKMSVFRNLFEDFAATDLRGDANDLALDFAKFKADGPSVEQHALFEALHATRLQADTQAWNWHDWPAEWRDPHSATVKSFAENNRHEILFHEFLQWIADRSFAAAQRQARAGGMRIGLVADLAVGMNSGGSQAWSNQDDVLGGVQIGAPPDLFNANGQNWGLTTFSPRALTRGGFGPFIATMRACMRHAGGVRIDHAMGFMRLWVTPYGAKASEGAYLSYPLDDLLRLTSVESYRHRAIVIGEDLGTVPAGFRERLDKAGIGGMAVLWFERGADGFAPPRVWPAHSAAMTSTHDLPTVAGWWRGSDLKTRANCGLLEDVDIEQASRDADRAALWQAFRAAKVGEGDVPAKGEVVRVVDAAVQFIARTPSQLALLPLEDALALEEQPNLPATIDEHPNWRRRYAGDAAHLLDPSDVRRRIEALTDRGG